MSRKPRFSVVKNVKVGEGTRIFDQTNLFNCKIGKNCKIDSFVYIEGNVEIGNNVKIRAFSFLPDGVKIGDDVFIGPGVLFTNDKYPRAKGDWKLLTTVVKDGASIGAGSVILPGVTIGKSALIGAGSIVSKDVPDCAVVIGAQSSIRGQVTDAAYECKVNAFQKANSAPNSI